MIDNCRMEGVMNTDWDAEFSTEDTCKPARTEMLGNISLEILKLARSLEMSVSWEGHCGAGKLRKKN